MNWVSLPLTVAFAATVLVGCAPSHPTEPSAAAAVPAEQQPTASPAQTHATPDEPHASAPASKEPAFAAKELAPAAKRPAPTASPIELAWPTPLASPGDITGYGLSPGSPPVTETTADGRYLVNGILIVNKSHPLPSSYVPAWASKPHGLHPEAYTAINKLIAGAKADGLKLTVRSGYRSYAEQAGSFSRAMRQYDEQTARKYFAEAGKSEHQTGLSLDVWDGVNRGTAFARLPQAKWLAKNAHKYGFIVRYPYGKEDVTGYAWESWHLRYVGTEIAARFGPYSSLTLEEYLGIAQP